MTFVVCGVAVGSHALRGTAGPVALIGALWLILGYALYCSAFAAAGAMITRQADAANAAFPLLIPLIVAYSLSSVVLFGGAYPFYRVLAFIPWTAPVAMPTLFAIGAAPAWQMIVSAVLCVIATIATARLAGLRLPAFRDADRRPRQAPPSPARQPPLNRRSCARSGTTPSASAQKPGRSPPLRPRRSETSTDANTRSESDHRRRRLSSWNANSHADRHGHGYPSAPPMQHSGGAGLHR